jgi:hypothetical protein
MRLLTVCCAIGFQMAVSACTGSSPTAPVTPAIPSCQANNTGTLTVGNTSRGTAQRIVLNGATIATLGAGSTTTAQTLAAGVPYTLEFYIANTNSYACTSSLVTVPQCSGLTRTCAFP